MVYLAPRFLALAALVATASIPSFVLQSDARAIGLVERHHDKSSHHTHSPSSFSPKGKGKVQEMPTIPLPKSAKEMIGGGSKAKKHRKGGRKHQNREVPVPRNDERSSLDSFPQPDKAEIEVGRGQALSDTHRLFGREEPQAAFSLHKREISRIYGKRERKIEEFEKQEMMDVARAKSAEAINYGNSWDQFDPHLKVGKYEIGNGREVMASEMRNFSPRSPQPHHHHGHHHHNDKVIVNGDHDDVHVHERRTSPGSGPDHHELTANKLGAGDELDNATSVGHVNEPRSPHHHHHHHHHDDYDKVVVNGDNDDVHVHERREPHHHHHHHHSEHETVVNGDNDNVRIHDRRANATSKQRKRSDSLDNMSPGVPGTVDIMAVDGTIKQKLASLILSSVDSSRSTLQNGTRANSDIDSESPFVLDASNTTQTQFFLVASSPQGGSGASVPSSSFANTLSVLKAAASSTDGGSRLADIQVTLQVPVFVPDEVTIKSYCATYNPNPPAPAPMYMDRCFSDKASDPENAGKMTESSLHKSQTFAYNPFTGTVRPMWFSLTGEPAVDSSAADLNGSNNGTSSTASREEKQMNFKIPSSNKYAPQHIVEQGSPIGNVTQTLNGTASPLPPLPSNSSSPQIPPPQNVTLVFTPAAPAVHVISSLSDAAAFKPANGASDSDSDAESDSESDEGTDNEDDVFTSPTTASLDSASETMSDNATTSAIDPGPSGLAAEKDEVTSDATDSYESETATASPSAFTGTDTSAVSTSTSVSDSISSSDVSGVVSTGLPTYIIDEAGSGDFMGLCFLLILRPQGISKGRGVKRDVHLVSTRTSRKLLLIVIWWERYLGPLSESRSPEIPSCRLHLSF